ncbi:MAG: MOSC domain-containing protein [Synechococcales cyanobacterium]
MQLLSLNVGVPREVEWQGKPVSTGIFKDPVAGSRRVRRLNIEGDGQADLTVHGGVEKAVYGYPAEHYDYWRQELPEVELSWGAFGENLTTLGLRETELCIGDRLRVGSAHLVVTQPRFPCFKLGIKFNDVGMVKRFLDSRRSGFYCAVEAEGEVQAGDGIDLLSRDPHGVTVDDIVRLYAVDKQDYDGMRRAIQVPDLAHGWREYFQERLDRVQHSTDP